jgi:cytochrome P450
MTNLEPLHSLESFARAREAFGAPIDGAPSVPTDLQTLVREISMWDAQTRRTWADYQRHSVYRRAVGIGTAMADAIRLQRAIRTRRIDEWLAAAPPATTASFEAWRNAFFARCDALAALGTEGLVASGLAMPDDGVLDMALHNAARLGRLIVGRSSLFATMSVYAGATVLVAREWEFFRAFAARQLRRAGVPLTASKVTRAIRRLNASAGQLFITHRHAEALLAAYEALEERGVSSDDADRLVLRALDYGHRASGKPWKGLNRLRDLMVYSGVDPKTAQWSAIFDETMHAPVDYTHVPGREWIVRDYKVGKHLMQIDGKIAPGDRWAGLQQGRGSLSTGYLRAGQERIEFGRRYSKSLAAFLDSMVVAEGPDHQRQRKAFLPFFTQAAVLEHALFVEQTVAALLDQAADVARRNGGAFDLRNDFAYQFPIRVICRILDLPAADVPAVQHWAEASVRAMDTEAGLSFATARAGQRAADQLRAYLERKLALARTGDFAGDVIGTVARDTTLSEAERVANLGVVIFAGFETTTGLLSKGCEALLRHPTQWAHLRDALAPAAPVEVDGSIIPDLEWRWLAWASTQPERNVTMERRDRLTAATERSPAAAARFEAIRRQEEVLERAVEELLRWTAPGTVVPLTASKDVALALESPLVVKCRRHAAGDSITIKRGETIAVAVDELNRRCPVGAGQFDTAGGTAASFDITRSDNASHLSFGLRHSCIGAFLAKENAKRAIEGILRRFPDLELAGDPIPQEMELFSGLACLPVRSRAFTGVASLGRQSAAAPDRSRPGSQAPP